MRPLDISVYEKLEAALLTGGPGTREELVQRTELPYSTVRTALDRMQQERKVKVHRAEVKNGRPPLVYSLRFQKDKGSNSPAAPDGGQTPTGQGSGS